MEIPSIDLALLASAAVSLAVSTIAFVVQRRIDRMGKMHVICTLTAPHIIRFLIAKDTSGSLEIYIPMTLDVYNSSYNSKAMRRIRMTLRYKGNDVLELSPANMIKYDDPHEGPGIEHIGNEAGVFSFSISGGDTLSKWLLFSETIPLQKREDFFDEVFVSFIDHRGKSRHFSALKLQQKISLGEPHDFGRNLINAPAHVSFR